MKLNEKSLEEILLENGKELEVDSTKIIAHENNDVFIIKKTSRKKVEDLLMSSHRMAQFKYVIEFDKYVALVNPVADIDGKIRSSDGLEEHSVVALIPRNPKLEKLLLNITNGVGTLHFVAISTELDTISARPFLSDSIGKMLIKKQIEYAEATSSNKRRNCGERESK